MAGWCLTILILAIFGFTSSVSAYTSIISICLCTEENGHQECGLLSGVVHRGTFVFVDEDNNEFSLPIEKMKTFPYRKCAHQLNKRFLIKLSKGLDVDLGIAHVGVGKDGVKAGVAGNEVAVGKDGVSGTANVDLGPLGHVKGGVAVGPDGASGNVDAAVHAGVVDANTKLNVAKDGHVSGEVGGKVNVEGVEVGGNVGVDKDGKVSGGASVGVGLGSLGGVDLHVTAGPDGVKTGVGAHIDAGPLHAGASIDVDQNGKVSAGANANANLGPAGQLNGGVSVDGNGKVTGGASGSLGVGPVGVSGNVNVGSGGVSGSVSGNVGVGPAAVNGNVNVGSGGVSGSVSGNVGVGPAAVNGNVNVGSGGVSGSVSGNVGVGPATVNGNVNVGSGGVSGSVSGNAGVGQINTGGSLNIGSNGQVTGSGSVNVGGMNIGSGNLGTSGSGSGSTSSSSSSGISSGGMNTGSGSFSSGSGPLFGGSNFGGKGSSTDFTGVNGIKPNFFNPGAMMSSLPNSGQAGTGYNPSTFFQQAGYQEFLTKMGYGKRR